MVGQAAVSTLKDKLAEPGVRSRVVTDAAQLVDDEVRARSGFSGLAIKAGYKAVQALKPSLIPEAIDGLLDRFVEQLEPFYTEWSGSNGAGSFDAFLVARRTRVADALLGVTDQRATQTGNRTIKKTYEKLRPYGEKNVAQAIPELGRVLSRYV